MFQMNRSVKKQKGISVGVVTLLCLVLMTSLQSAEAWKPLFNGKDFTGWTVGARGGGPSLSPADAGWKMESGIIVGGQAGPGQRGGSLVSQAQFKDVELELDFMLAEQPAAPDGSCTMCTYKSGVERSGSDQLSMAAWRRGWLCRIREAPQRANSGALATLASSWPEASIRSRRRNPTGEGKASAET